MPPEAKPSRKPSGRPRRPTRSRARDRERSRAAQRLRLALALIDEIADNGYHATRVADVIARAGVSRKTFYEHFANKQECLLVTFDMIADEGMRRVEHAYRQAHGWPGRVEAAIRALFESVIDNPGALRLSLLEIAAVGPPGIARRERSLERYERFIRDALELAPGDGTVSETVLMAVIGGLNRVLYRRVLRGQDAELLALVPDLTSWATSYYPTPPAILAEPSPLAEDRRRSSLLEGGRAPGTLAPHPVLGGRRGLPRGEQNVSRKYVEHSQRTRILDAVANLTASDGYAQLKVEGIAEHAAVSLKVFYEQYGSKEDAFLVAYEIGHGKALSMVERAYAAQSDWRLSIHAGIAALFEFLATEPSFAHIALLDALVATPRAAERSNAGMTAFARLLVPALDEAPGETPPAAVTVEAIAGGIFDLCVHYALQGRIRELPELTPSATYIALAPFIGGEEAALLATGRPAPPRPPARRRTRAKPRPRR
ncbi:MAG TPA: TetR/AcrR family transcriptional regulator [Solirubrobacteraceae bacterium]|nr:TetR/AcrR family transcriptional regulator [Solirubrobacteraceae bacterium]